jgi:predicted transcriptional regulator
MPVILTPETETRLEAEAAQAGQDIDSFLISLLDAVGAMRADNELTEADKAAIREGIERGLADGGAGRVRPAEEVYARLKDNYGI